MAQIEVTQAVDKSGWSSLLPPRDRLPTLPCDLSEYARVHTGPSSWSAQPERRTFMPAQDDPFADLLDSIQLALE